jgi:hypothetical protein
LKAILGVHGSDRADQKPQHSAAVLIEQPLKRRQRAVSAPLLSLGHSHFPRTRSSTAA